MTTDKRSNGRFPSAAPLAAIALTVSLCAARLCSREPDPPHDVRPDARGSLTTTTDSRPAIAPPGRPLIPIPILGAAGPSVPTRSSPPAPQLPAIPLPILPGGGALVSGAASRSQRPLYQPAVPSRKSPTESPDRFQKKPAVARPVAMPNAMSRPRQHAPLGQAPLVGAAQQMPSRSAPPAMSPHGPASPPTLPAPTQVLRGVTGMRNLTASPVQQTQEFEARIESRRSTDRWWQPPARNTATAPIQLWWNPLVRQPLGRGGTLPIQLAAVCEGALRHSSFVQVVTAEPVIQQTALVQEQARFDWRAFLETTYLDLNEPVGNALTTGNNATRYKNQDWSFQAGMRRKNLLGGELEMSQQLGRQRDNSRFLSPNPQRTARLELQYTQPLMRGAGQAYNQSLTVLAQIKLDQSQDTVRRQLEQHLVKVTEAFWQLYQTRAEFLQRKKLLDSAERILTNLKGRREVDAVERQVLRAETAVANRQSEMIRAEARIKDWQSRLRLLVNDPALVYATAHELTPIDTPLASELPLALADSLHTALINRPDIARAIRSVHSAAVKLGVAEQDVLPKLDLVASSYVSGLEAAARKGQAFATQFTQGRPTFSVGLLFEAPLGNRAAQAQAARRQAEMNKELSSYRLTVEEALTSVELAVREVHTSFRELQARSRAMRAAQSEAEYLEDRWRVLPGPRDSAAQLLENLLDVQERVAEEESAVVRAQVKYALTLVQLKSEMGTLLRSR